MHVGLEFDFQCARMRRIGRLTSTFIQMFFPNMFLAGILRKLDRSFLSCKKSSSMEKLKTNRASPISPESDVEKVDVSYAYAVSVACG